VSVVRFRPRPPVMLKGLAEMQVLFYLPRTILALDAIVGPTALTDTASLQARHFNLRSSR